MPCRGKLARLFSEHKKSCADLEALRARLSRAESDEAAALDSSLMSDEEVSERIEAAQSARRVYGARVTAREAAIEKQVAELKSAIGSASTEISMLVRELHTKQRNLITEAILNILQPEEPTFDIHQLPELLECDLRLINIRAIEQSGYMDLSNVNAITTYADMLLKAYEQIEAHKERLET
jgi:chromosome segregation ATPase